MKEQLEMSEIKYQLKQLLPTFNQQVRDLKNNTDRGRWAKIRAIVTSTKSVAKACRQEGCSESWFFKWADRLLTGRKLTAICAQSRKPNRSPQKTPKRVVKRIKKLRQYEPFSGPERISHDLKDYYNINCPPGTVYNVLKRENLISKEHSKKLTKKHTKRYRRPDPGYLQMDFKYVPYKIKGEQHYQLSCVDHHSTWRFIRCYPSKETGIVISFLNALARKCPFPIIEIQTDNDSAFTDKFTSQKGIKETGEHAVDEWCQAHDINHRLIPVGQKELNGKVENTHKQDDREFYSQVHALTYDGLKISIAAYNGRWNERRRTKALNWQTPWEAVQAAYVRMLVWLNLIREIYHPNVKPTITLSENGNFYLNIPAPQSGKKKIRTRRLSAVDRYLQWSDWDDKKRKGA
jgi:transposase InsO family protein